jgi:hypothetical protein
MNKIKLNRKAVLALALIIVALMFFTVVITTLRNEEHKIIGIDSTPTATSSSTSPLPTPSEQPKNYPQLNITIEQVATFSDRYFVKGSLHQSDTTYGTIESVDISNMSISDATGKQIPIGPIDFGLSPVASGLEFSFYTYSKGSSGPLALTISSANFNAPVASPIFEIDFGDHIQDNQEWKIVKDFDLSGHHIQIADATMRFIDNEPELEFTITGPDVTSVVIADKSIKIGGSEELKRILRDNKLLMTLKYSDGVPTGQHQFAIENISFTSKGSWQTTFLPESIDKSPSQAASDLQNACFLNNDWMKSQNEIPSKSSISGVTGRLLVENSFLDDNPNPLMAIIDLNSNDKKYMLPLSPATLSPDGSMMVMYDWATQKIHLLNLQNEQDTYITWAIAPERTISWTSNGDKLVYDRDDGIYVNSLDGANLHNIPLTEEGIYLGGWMPDAQHILVTHFLAKEAKPQLQTVDINTGVTKDLFSISNISPVPILSPDGRNVLFSDVISGTKSIGVFTSTLDGAGRHLLASFQYLSVFSYAWSPGSNWVILSVTDQVNSRNNVTNLLINPNTCETSRLSNLDWMVRFWSPKP